jgi:hypothetical protein
MILCDRTSVILNPKEILRINLVLFIAFYITYRWIYIIIYMHIYKYRQLHTTWFYFIYEQTIKNALFDRVFIRAIV